MKILEINKNFSIYFLISSFVKVLTLVIDIIIINKFSKTQFANYSIAIMIANFVLVFGFSWHASAFIYLGARERELTGKINQTFHSRNVLSIVAIIVISILLFLFYKNLNLYIGKNIAYLLYIYVLVRVISDYFLNYFLTVEKQKISRLVTLIPRIILISIIIFFNFDIFRLFKLMIISEISVVFLFYFVDFKDLSGFEINSKKIKEYLNFSSWQLFGVAGLLLINFGDLAIIKYYLNNEAIADYNAAYKLFAGIESLSMTIVTFFAANISKLTLKKDFNKLKQFYNKQRWHILGILIFGQILIIFSAKYIIPIFFQDQYFNSINIFRILMLGCILRYFSLFYTLLLNTNKKYYLLQIVNISRAILNIILDIILIKFFGIFGPAIATVLAIFIVFIPLSIYSENYIKNKLELDAK